MKSPTSGAAPHGCWSVRYRSLPSLAFTRHCTPYVASSVSNRAMMAVQYQPNLNEQDDSHPPGEFLFWSIDRLSARLVNVLDFSGLPGGSRPTSSTPLFPVVDLCIVKEAARRRVLLVGFAPCLLLPTSHSRNEAVKHHSVLLAGVCCCTSGSLTSPHSLDGYFRSSASIDIFYTSQYVIGLLPFHFPTPCSTV